MTLTATSFAPSDLADNGYSTLLDNWYEQSSPLARAVFTTDATEVIIEVFCPLYNSYPQYSQVGVRVDGADYTTLACVRSGVNGLSLSLPGGTHTVELVVGLQSISGATVLGTYLRRAWVLNGTVAKVAPSANNRIVIYGDSIACGQAATSPPLQSWPALVRAHWAGSLLLEAWGNRSLYDDANTAGLRAAFVARLAGYSPAAIWLAIGTNDYGLNKWSAASFGTAYAAVLDDLHTALPSATIYCQTPTPRSSEVANGSGSTLGDYRAQIATAQSTRGPWAALVDGTAIVTVGALADGVHPTTAGHATYAASVRATLGV